MKGQDTTARTEIVEMLNEVLTAELTAVNQYFVDAKMFENWGYLKLAAIFRQDSIDEMKDADELISRILFLEGVPNLQRLGTVRVGETPEEKLRLFLDVEIEAITRLNQCVARARELGDNGTTQLFESMLTGEEAHADWAETQLDLIAKIGVQNYLAQQL